MDFTHDPFDHDMTHGQPNGLPIASLSLDHPEKAGRSCPKGKEKAEAKKSRLPFFLHYEPFSDLQFL